MKQSLLKSIGAILAGFMLGAILSIAADAVLEKLNFFSTENFKYTSTSILLLIILYRFAFNATGCYLTAKLAPQKPMLHVSIIGVLGTVLSILGSVIMWDKTVPFYNIAIILISFPSAWIGGKMYVRRTRRGDK